MKKSLNIYVKALVFAGVVIFLFLCIGVKIYAQLPDVEILGGRYEDVFYQPYDHDKFEVHHLISKQAWKRIGAKIKYSNGGITLGNQFITDDERQNWAPSILMSKEDHERTRSHMILGDKAYAHIDHEFDMLSSGKVWNLLNEERDDIQQKFGDKYDRALGQMFSSMRGNFQRHGYRVCIFDQKTDHSAHYYLRDKPCWPQVEIEASLLSDPFTLDSSSTSVSSALISSVPFTHESLALSVPLVSTTNVLCDFGDSSMKNMVSMSLFLNPTPSTSEIFGSRTCGEISTVKIVSRRMRDNFSRNSIVKFAPPAKRMRSVFGDNSTLSMLSTTTLDTSFLFSSSGSRSLSIFATNIPFGDSISSTTVPCIFKL